LAILDPEHLFEQAFHLLKPPPAGPPRQVDVRRAISSAYYGVFHATVTAAADEFVGKTKRSTSNYALVYRSIDHRRVREVCLEIQKQTPSSKFLRYVPQNGFGPNLREFCTALVELQEKRHSADYDPSIRVKTSDALIAIGMAKSALLRYGGAGPPARKAFLALLLFTPR
jgi:uncharacterized protein (UPF0332 family)